MKVFCSLYTLTPQRRTNRLSTLDIKTGVYLKAVLGDKTLFADYFPHIPLGDRPVEQFLDEFKFQEQEYDRKVFDLLLRDHTFQKLSPKRIKNHQLWDGTGPVDSSVVKYKLMDQGDYTFAPLLEKGVRLRLDSNGLFTLNEYENFLKEIPEKFLSQIEYIEDPLSDQDWSKLKVPSARDFIEGNHYDYHIYKPNCEFKPETHAKVIYSSYLGSDFGRWHAYCELIQTGVLNENHGIVARGVYDEEQYFLYGNYQDGFLIDTSDVRRIYQGLSQLEWKLLCSM